MVFWVADTLVLVLHNQHLVQIEFTFLNSPVEYTNMKKSLLAIAALASLFAGAANAADASVTVYGQIEASVSSVNDGASSLSGATGNNTAVGNAASVNGLQSRVGLRGEENLGAGNAAFFNLEHRLDTATGASSSSAFWGGRAVVGLKNAAWGEVALGRDYSPAYSLAVNVDPFRFDGTVGQLGRDHLFAGYTTNDGDYRINNGLFYRTADFAGFTVALAAGAGEGVTKSEYGANIAYNNGPLSLGVAYDEAGDDNLAMIGGAYDFGIVKPMASYTRSEVGGVKTTNFSLGATAPLFNGQVKAAVAKLNPDGADNNTTKFALGYEYGLSKRTSVFANLGTAKTQGLSSTTGYDVGVRHKF